MRLELHRLRYYRGDSGNWERSISSHHLKDSSESSGNDSEVDDLKEDLDLEIRQNQLVMVHWMRYLHERQNLGDLPFLLGRLRRRVLGCLEHKYIGIYRSEINVGNSSFIWYQFLRCKIRCIRFSKTFKSEYSYFILPG